MRDGDQDGLFHSAGYDVGSMERNSAGVELTRRTVLRVRLCNLGVEEYPGRILACDGGGLFDAVVTTEVIERLFAPQLLPMFARRLLRSGGYLVVSTPYHGYPEVMAASALGKWDSCRTPLWYDGLIKFWSRMTLTELRLACNGFRVTGSRGVDRVPLLWKSMIVIARVCGS